jgi:hypothetical protein
MYVCVRACVCVCVWAVLARAHQPTSTYACNHTPLDTCIPPATNNLAAASAYRHRRCCRLGLPLPGSSAPNPPCATTSDSAARRPAVSRQRLTRWHCTPRYYLLLILLARADGPQEHETETHRAGECPRWQEPHSCQRCCWIRTCMEVRAAMFDPRAQSRKPARARIVFLCSCGVVCVRACVRARLATWRRCRLGTCTKRQQRAQMRCAGDAFARVLSLQGGGESLSQTSAARVGGAEGVELNCMLQAQESPAVQTNTMSRMQKAALEQGKLFGSAFPALLNLLPLPFSDPAGFRLRNAISSGDSDQKHNPAASACERLNCTFGLRPRH